jgi:hypothetical protein
MTEGQRDREAVREAERKTQSLCLCKGGMGGMGGMGGVGGMVSSDKIASIRARIRARANACSAQKSTNTDTNTVCIPVYA